VKTDDPDAVLLSVSRLAMLTPDARRAARTRERCRARLRRPVPASQRNVGLALCGALGVLYLAALALDILRLRGVV
jgi:hypothetical protein